MGLKFWEFLRPKSNTDGTTQVMEVMVSEMMEASREYKIRQLCFYICVNLIATAVGRCEFRTFRNHKEIQEDEYYLWNYEPNPNQNSTAFLHELVHRLYKTNEVLIISEPNGRGGDYLYIASSWVKPPFDPRKDNVYRDVRVGDYTYPKPFSEGNVMHLKLNHVNIKPVLDGMTDSFYRLYDAAVRAYEWSQGQHWKVHVSQVASGTEDFTSKFAKMIEEQIKPFLNSNGAVLPEFDGYTYTNVGKDTQVKDTRDIKALAEDMFDFTARTFLIPAVLVNGKVEATADANNRMLSWAVDPACDQIQEEAVRKRYGRDQWRQGNYLRVDSSAIVHFDIFAMAPNVEKLVGSGVYTINGVLRACGQPTIDEPWADEHYMTKNIAKMGDVAASLEGQKGEN